MNFGLFPITVVHRPTLTNVLRASVGPMTHSAFESLFAGKKGKKTKGKAVPLMDFLANTPSNGESSLAAVLNPPKSRFSSWADEQDDEPNMPTPLIQLPTAPRASRSFDDDSVPKNGPFLAYLSNLPYDLDDADLEDYFSFLSIVSVRLPREDGGRSRGYGYVEFETRDHLIEAISMPDPTINNRHIRIDVSTENDRRRQDRQGGRYGESLSAGESNWRRGGPSNDDYNDRRGGDREFRGNSRYSSQTPARDTNTDWRTADRPSRDDDGPSRGGRGGDDRDGGGFRERYGGRRSNYEDRMAREPSPPSKERPRLQLQPRTLPVEPIVVPAQEEEKARERSPSPPRPKPVPAANIFGAAKPVDTAAREREIEERLEKERAEERRLREEAREKAKLDAANSEQEGQENEAPLEEKKPEEKEKEKPAVVSWRRETDDNENGGPTQRSNFRRNNSPDGGRGPRRDRDGDQREDRRGGYREDRRDDRRAGEYRGGNGARGGDRDRRMDRNE